MANCLGNADAHFIGRTKSLAVAKQSHCSLGLHHSTQKVIVCFVCSSIGPIKPPSTLGNGTMWLLTSRGTAYHHWRLSRHKRFRIHLVHALQQMSPWTVEMMISQQLTPPMKVAMDAYIHCVCVHTCVCVRACFYMAQNLFLCMHTYVCVCLLLRWLKLYFCV